jgi:hypothetical protein
MTLNSFTSGLIGVGTGGPIAVHNLRSGFFWGDPFVGSEISVVVPPRQALLERPTEDVAEVAGLRVGQVLDKTEKVGAGRSERTTDVVLRQAVELPEDVLARFLQVAVKVLLGDSVVHGSRLPCQKQSNHSPIRRLWPIVSHAASLQLGVPGHLSIAISPDF